MYCYDSGILNKDKKIIEEKFNNIKYFMNEKETISKEYKENFIEEFKLFKGINYNDYNEGVKYKSFEFIYYNLEKLYNCNLFTEEFYLDYKKLYFFSFSYLSFLFKLNIIFLQ